ncbi:MAG: hypothetical protein K0Q53_145 [Massilibacillus sp.]|jgi:hypothetical protein|nr:hypothetical protein [Massilibacillus sp.]
MSELQPKSNDIKIWRYYLPNTERKGWGIFIIDEKGYFSAVTDYGNYAFMWSSFGSDDFREFVIEISNNPGYVLGKVAKKEYDGEQTCKDIKELIIELRRDGSFAKEEARREWDLLKDNEWLETDVNFTRFYDETEIDDVCEFYRKSYGLDEMEFAKELLPRLAEEIKKQLQSEVK